MPTPTPTRIAPSADVEAASPPGTAAEDPPEDQEPAVEPAEATSPQDEEATVAMAEPSTGGEDTTTDVTAEEPIRLEQPEPARSGRSEDERDGSLRELFWGEE